MAAIPTALTDSAQVVPVGSACTLCGWSIHEAAETPAVATVAFHTGDADGPIVAVVELAASGSSTEFFGAGGVRCADGLYAEVVAGGVEGAVYHQ